ncbi:MAG TPA: hypothetical protein VF786_14830 [Terriglobales bacterium]
MHYEKTADALSTCAPMHGANGFAILRYVSATGDWTYVLPWFASFTNQTRSQLVRVARLIAKVASSNNYRHRTRANLLRVYLYLHF